ncbi:hypothetical protein [Streptosporangium sp. NBC_01469]|uniref:hypothetical protein n=1 Tax=Streptosporangium sp. NBC_01469 TaxID=2903898 RepID=UPI002E2C2AB8|nr:hypothetical protein [Streptosporangium sp. NBC_01469]
MNKYVTAVAAISLVALAGCGQTGGAKVASAGEPAASATPSASSQADGLKFAQCMRENGVDMPDPEPGGNNVMLRGKTDDDTLKKASETCRKYNPVGSGKKMLNDPKTQDALLRFARCMRENGVDMPDPEPGGNNVMLRGKTDDDTLKKASETCRKYNPVGSGKKMLNDPKTQDALLRFARCMRENGVDMKDPDFSGGAVRIGGEGMDPESPRTKKAIESCQEHLPGGLGKRP